MTHDGVYYRVESGDTLDFHDNLPAMRADINNMRAIHIGEQKWFKREDKWSIRECFGFTEVLVHGGVRKHKEVDKLKVKEEQYLIMPVPFIRVPDAHGVLLALGDFNYEGTLELWDPYEGQGDIRENYPYAPVTYTTASGKEIQLNRKIGTVNIGSNIPDFAIAWAASMGGYDPFIKYKEPDKLWGGMYHPDYPWYSDGFENYYGMDLSWGGGLDWCVDDGNWSSTTTTQVTFNGTGVGPVYTMRSLATDHVIETTGSRIQIVAYTPASNYSNKWGCIVEKYTMTSTWGWYPGETFCTEDPMGVGTWVGEYTGTYTHEFVFIDSFGSEKVIDTVVGKSAIGAGFVKMYEFGDRTVFTFNFYSSTTGGKFAGLAENGNVTVTDISTLVDKDGNSYSQPIGQNHVGLVLFEYLIPHERVVDIY